MDEANNTQNSLLDADTLQLGAVHFNRAGLLDEPPETADCVVNLNGKDFPVHKAILAPVSLYFEQVLSGEWVEGTRQHIAVTIEGATPDDFEWVLRTAYGEDKAVDKKQIEGVLKVASYFQLQPLVDRLQEIVSRSILTARELLDLKITHPGILDKIADTIQLKQEDVIETLAVATKAGASALQKRCGKALAETVLTKDVELSKLTELPVATLVGCFSSDTMSGLQNEDALLNLIFDVCQAEKFTDEMERVLASCVRLQYLSVQGIEQAFKWPAIDRNAMIAALAKQRDPTAFPEVPRESARRFYVAFSPELSKGNLSFHDCSTVVVHHSKTRAVAVVDTPCERGIVVRVTFLLFNDKKGDEGTCFGVVPRLDVGPIDYREATGPLWRAYNGEVRENRAVTREIAKVHPKDEVTIVIDGVLRRIEFIKENKQIFVKDSIPDGLWPLCPAVWFYGNNEKVIVQSRTTISGNS